MSSVKYYLRYEIIDGDLFIRVPKTHQVKIEYHPEKGFRIVLEDMLWVQKVRFPLYPSYQKQESMQKMQIKDPQLSDLFFMSSKLYE